MIRSVNSTYSAIRRVSRSAITAGPKGRTCVHTPILGTLRRSRTYRTTSHPIHINDLGREVADSIGWRRFCRLGLDQPVPHPTTLVKLVRRAGPDVIEQLNQALVAKLTGDKLLRARKLRVDTTVVEADIDYPTDADLLEHAVRKLGGLVRRIKGRGAASPVLRTCARVGLGWSGLIELCPA